MLSKIIYILLTQGYINMKSTHFFVLSSLTLAMGLSSSVNAMESEKNIEKSDKDVEQILILGVRQDRVSKGATGLTLELNETPQSISVISAEQIKNFATTNDAENFYYGRADFFHLHGKKPFSITKATIAATTKAVN